MKKPLIKRLFLYCEYLSYCITLGNIVHLVYQDVMHTQKIIKKLLDLEFNSWFKW